MKPPTIWRPAIEGNYAKGRRAKISQITFHHIVGDANGAIARFQTIGEEVSAHYVIGSDGTIYQCVRDGDTAYTDANRESNARSITIEHAGGHPRVPYTDAMYHASARLVAWLIQEYGITSFKKHCDVSDKPTACPGELDVNRILKEAKGEEMATEKILDILWHMSHGVPPNAADKRKWLGKPTNEVIVYLANDGNRHQYVKRINAALEKFEQIKKIAKD